MYRNAHLILLAVLVLPSVAFAQELILNTQYCVDSSLVSQNYTVLGINSSNTVLAGNFSQTFQCPYGCDNSTGGMNDCEPNPNEPTIFFLIAPIVLAMVGLALIYIASQFGDENWVFAFLFTAMSLFVMIANVFISVDAMNKAFQSGLSNILSAVGFLLIVLALLFIFAYIIRVLKETFGNMQKGRSGLNEQGD